MPMTFDGRTGMSLEWNDLGLVEKVGLNDTDLVNYSYLADGTKVSALDGDGDGLLYFGSLIYKKTGDSIELESAGFAGGRFVARETAAGSKTMVPMFHVTDHLGSVRAVVDGISGAVVETNDYYPFGGRWDVAASLKDDSNRFRYSSKEEQSSLYPASIRNAVSYIDYGARQYDPVLGRWFAQDPLSEKYYSISPYAFCGNNPIRYEDVDGEDWVDKAAGYFIGGVTNVVPGTGFIRDWYSPDNSEDYNTALKRTDETAAALGTGMMKAGTGAMAAGGALATAGVEVTASTAGAGAVVGGPAVAAGAEIAAAGAATAATGGVLVMNSSKNKNDGYERGKNTSTDNSTKKKSGNQLQRDIEKGKAPKSIDRYDVGKGDYEKPHVHFKDGNTLNQDGTWKHGGRDLTNKEKEFLKRYGWETK